MSTRDTKAQTLAASGQIVRAENSFFVPSQSQDGHWYRVTVDEDGPRCTCRWSSIHPNDPCAHVLSAAIVAQREMEPT